MSQQRTQSRQAEPERMQQTSGQARNATSVQGDLRPVEDVFQYVCEYTRQRPERVALTCFAVGFILGWRLKPW
jgi:hypothetical protein